jgi:hypothetical protein
MRNAKAGAWWEAAPWRYIANNSAVYSDTPTREAFHSEWQALVASGTGERGLFSRSAATAQAARSRGRITDGILFGTNPCSEIILRPQQFCNLTEVHAQNSTSQTDASALQEMLFQESLLWHNLALTHSHTTCMLRLR